MLISCVAYQDGKKLADIDKSEISDYLERPGCFVWVALRDPAPAELDEMQEEFGLHPLAVEDARNGHQRPKIEEYGDSLFVVLQSIEVRDGELHVGEVDVFVGSNYVLSVRSRLEKGFHDVRERTEREPDMLRTGPAYVLYALMDAVVDRYFPVIDILQTALEVIEERMFDMDSPGRTNIEALYALRRKLTTLEHILAPLLEAVSKLYGGRVPHICTGMQEYFRDIYDHLSRLNQSVDSLRETVVAATSVNLALITLQESETVKRLAAYGALVAVPTMIAGIYGMNFHHMPELDWTFGYPLALGIMTAIDLFLFWRFRKAGWL
jgi:magnesium transporter